MRITNSILQRSVLRQLTSNLSNLAKAQEQVATGKRVSVMSDDPGAGAQVMRADHTLRAVEQYRRNVASARVRMHTEESVIGHVQFALERAKEIGVAMGGDTVTPTERLAAADEITRILDQVVQLGNSVVGAEHIFGGGATAAPPFQPDGTYIGDDTVRQTAIGTGAVLATNHTGRELLEDSGVIAGLISLRDALVAGTTAGVQTALTDIDAGLTGTATLTGEIGARIRHLDVAEQSLVTLEFDHQVVRSEYGDVPLAEATTRFMALQNSLETAFAAASRILTTNLGDFLR